MEYSFGTPLAAYGEWILLALRILLGATFLYYGLPKFREFLRDGNHSVVPDFNLRSLWRNGVALFDVVGGVLLILGTFTVVLAAFFGIRVLADMLWKVSSPRNNFVEWSQSLLLLGVALMLLAFGPGAVVLFTIY